MCNLVSSNVVIRFLGSQNREREVSNLLNRFGVTFGYNKCRPTVWITTVLVSFLGMTNVHIRFG